MSREQRLYGYSLKRRMKAWDDAGDRSDQMNALEYAYDQVVEENADLKTKNRELRDLVRKLTPHVLFSDALRAEIDKVLYDDSERDDPVPCITADWNKDSRFDS